MDRAPTEEAHAFPDDRLPPQPVKGRGAVANPGPRFDALDRQKTDDGWGADEEEGSPSRTTLLHDASKSIINRNDSPDVPFTQSINPYRGCEHGCIYCFARPSHAYLGLSPGLDFETKIVVKEDAARLLREELAKPRYACQPIALGTNTDCYQPVERRLRIEEWLRHHEPGKAGHILSLIRQMRGGRLNDPRFGERMRGSGPYADMIRQRCHAACNRLGLNQRDSPLDCNRFVPPRAVSPQLALFQEGSD